jgi:hypothetical protein
MYLSVTIPKADFAYPAQLGFIFDGKTFLGKIAISRPSGMELNLQFEYYPRNWLTTTEVFLMANGRRYNMVSFIPHYENIREIVYDPKELAQDLKSSGFDSRDYPELAEFIDYREKDELESLLEKNRANSAQNNAMKSLKSTLTSPGVSPTLTPFIAVNKGIAKGELTLVIAKDRCGTSKVGLNWTKKTFDEFFTSERLWVTWNSRT